ncbi:MAG TPA: PilN domain-containing protein [Gaiellaceae bacterium]
MRAVNLLPKDDRRQRGAEARRQNPVLIGGVSGAVLVTAILCAWFLTASGGVANNQKRRDAAQAELAATPVPAPTSSDSSALEQEKGARVAALSGALGTRLAWDRVLREFALVLPDDVWLTSLSAQSPSAGGGTAGFSIIGRTYSQDGVARLLARLALVPHLTNVTLQSSASTVSETGRKVVEFTINATLKGVGA